MESGGKYESWESEEMRGGRRSCAFMAKEVNLVFLSKGGGGGREGDFGKRGGEESKYFQQKRKRLVAQSL